MILFKYLLTSSCGRDTETQLLVGENDSRVFILRQSINLQIMMFNPLSPHDALKHHFKSLKNYLISYN